MLVVRRFFFSRILLVFALMLVLGADGFKIKKTSTISTQPIFTSTAYKLNRPISSSILSDGRSHNAQQILHSSKVDSSELSDYSTDLKRTGLWVAAAGAFAAGIAAVKGTDSAIEFASGYILEQSLSVDNLFVFLVLFDYFAIPKEYQNRVLTYGLWGAIILRGIFVAAGAVALQQFHQVLLVFAVILGFSSFKILFSGGDDDEEDMSENAVVKFARNFLKTTDKFDGEKFFTEVNGEKLATPLFLCLVCVELSDVVFAFDSVPAVFGVTEDPFIVYTSNLFAISGLRSLFGVLSTAISKLIYLDKAVGVVLGVISAKLFGETFGYELLTPLQSLAVVLTILGVGVAASLAKTSADE